jgi:hypothetical protein
VRPAAGREREYAGDQEGRPGGEGRTGAH